MAQHLVVQLARFGDLVQSKRLVLSLAQLPDSTAHLAVDESLAPLASILYPFAVVHELAAHAAPGASPGRALQKNARAFSLLAKQDFSGIYNLNLSPMATALAGMFDPALVRGYRLENGQPLADPWCDLAARLTASRRTSPLNLADFWACLHPAPLDPAQVNPPARPAGSGKIGVVLAGRMARRSLPPEALAACLQAVFEARGGPEVLLLGSAQERPLARRLARLFSQPLLQKTSDLSGVCGLEGLPEILKSLDLLLTPDTGLMHLAASLGVPVQAFFLSSAWCFETGPYGLGHLIWQAKKPCSPCLESAPCPHGVACLKSFSHPAFLSHLAGKFIDDWPPDLLGLVSGLDPLGVTYRRVDGADEQAGERSRLRGLLAEYLGVGLFEPGLGRADGLFLERDWMLPGASQGGVL